MAATETLSNVDFYAVACTLIPLLAGLLVFETRNFHKRVHQNYEGPEGIVRLTIEVLIITATLLAIVRGEVAGLKALDTNEVRGHTHGAVVLGLAVPGFLLLGDMCRRVFVDGFSSSDP